MRIQSEKRKPLLPVAVQDRIRNHLQAMTHLRELDLAGETIGIRAVEDMSFAKDLVKATLTVSCRASMYIDCGKEKEEDTEKIDARDYEWVRKQA